MTGCTCNTALVATWKRLLLLCYTKTVYSHIYKTRHGPTSRKFWLQAHLLFRTAISTDRMLTNKCIQRTCCFVLNRSLHRTLQHTVVSKSWSSYCYTTARNRTISQACKYAYILIMRTALLLENLIKSISKTPSIVLTLLSAP